MSTITVTQKAKEENPKLGHFKNGVKVKEIIKVKWQRDGERTILDPDKPIVAVFLLEKTANMLLAKNKGKRPPHLLYVESKQDLFKFGLDPNS